MGQFYYSAKAFDVLERLDPNPEYWEGKRGACVGIFQMILAGREPKYIHLICILRLLRGQYFDHIPLLHQHAHWCHLPIQSKLIFKGGNKFR